MDAVLYGFGFEDATLVNGAVGAGLRRLLVCCGVSSGAAVVARQNIRRVRQCKKSSNPSEQYSQC